MRHEILLRNLWKRMNEKLKSQSVPPDILDLIKEIEQATLKALAGRNAGR